MNRPLLLSIVITSLLLGLIILTITPLFYSNDDVYMAMISRGFGISPEQSQNLIFSHILLGNILNKLPSVWGIEPYGLHTYFAIILTAIICNFSILRCRLDILTIILVAFLDLLVFVPVMAQPQFTVVAALLASAATLLVLSLALRRPTNRVRLIGGICIAAFVGLYGCLVRMEAFIMIMLIAFTASSFAFITKPKILLTKHLPIALLIAFSLLALYRIDHLSYQNDPEWKSFHRFNWLRCQFTDYQRVDYSEKTKKIFEHVGWNENDYKMINAWYFMHEPTYSLANLEYVVAGFPMKNHIISRLPSIKNIARKIWRRRIMTPVILALPLIYFISPRRNRWYLFLLIVAATIVALGLHLVGRLPVHVFFPLFSSLLVFGVFLYVYRSGSLQWANKQNLVAICLIGGLAGWQATAVMSNNMKNSVHVGQVRADIAALHPGANQLFVAWGGDFPFQDAFPPLGRDSLLHKMKMFGLASTSGAPFSSHRLAEFGIKDLSSAFYQRDDVFLIAKEENELLTTFIRDHYGVTTKPVIYFQGETFKVFRLKMIEEQASRKVWFQFTPGSHRDSSPR